MYLWKWYRNQKIFSFRQNDVSDTQLVMSCGRLFQSVGPAAANDDECAKRRAAAKTPTADVEATAYPVSK